MTLKPLLLQVLLLLILLSLWKLCLSDAIVVSGCRQ